MLRLIPALLLAAGLWAPTIQALEGGTGRQAISSPPSLPIGTPVIRAGTGCTHATLQAAVNSVPVGGSAIIRARGQSFNETLTISNRNIELIGGHANCTSTSPGATSILNGASGGAALNFFTLNNDRELIVANFDITGGNGGVLSPGGGITVATGSGNATVFLENTWISGNAGLRGGGIHLNAGASGSGTALFSQNTRFLDNIVTGEQPHGGGIYCTGDFNIIMVGGTIAGNIAGENAVNDTPGLGGGAYFLGCDFSWFAQASTVSSDDASLRGNITRGGGDGVWGGGAGIFAKGDSQVNLYGAHLVLFGDPISSRPLVIRNNQATGQGSRGGAFWVGDTANLRVDRSWIHDNSSASFAGALFVDGHGTLTVERGAQVCHTPRACSRVFDNHAGGGMAVGGAFGNGTLRLRRTLINGNETADDTFTRSILESQFGGTVIVEDSIIHDNLANTIFMGFSDPGNPTIRVLRSTVAANRFHGNFSDAVIRPGGAASVIELNNSIFQESVPMLWNPFALQGDCVLWHEAAAGGAVTRATVGDAMFVDAAVGSFYLQPGSPAINYCNTVPPSPAVDLEWRARGVPHSGQPALHGQYDLGALEQPVFLFRDRFEAR